MLPSISTAAPSTRNGRRSAFWSRPTSAPARSSLPVPIERMTNSSPPTRATVSISRTIASNRRASDFSTRSPARCPRTSFTSLKPSRSIAISVNGSPERRERRNACSMRSSRSTRFGRPVSGSRSASEWALSSRQLRTTPAAAATNAQTTSAAATWSGVSRNSAVNRLAPSTSAARQSAHTNVLLSCRRLVLIVTRRRSAPPPGAAAGTSDSSAESSRSSPPERGTGIPRRRERERSRDREEPAGDRGISHAWISLRDSSGCCWARSSRPLADRIATNAPLHDPLLRSVPRSPRLPLVLLGTASLGGACGLVFGFTLEAAARRCSAGCSS